ncbi:sphingosine kinase 1 isoform X1 [Lates japonicus]|uniref:Sphingosine kinase 1 isoform X1 n=1 Tax=Lates japonicus TaxID=270547 RepID=A0AAD3NMQ3_LATJO|nr:sphingosine kinase 1 isoform X1 [Lates japonicus]
MWCVVISLFFDNGPSRRLSALQFCASTLLASFRRRLTSAPVGRNKVVLSPRLCRLPPLEDDNADPAAYLSAYFYPLKRRWMSSGVARQSEYCFRLGCAQDPRANHR